MKPKQTDLAVVGAGAAGLWAAIRAATVYASCRENGGGSSRPRLESVGKPAPPSVTLLERGRRPGLKILMSGGSRCNLTHREVRAEDYRGGSRHRIRQVLQSHPPDETLRVFREQLGVEVREEDDGRIFPADGVAQTVLDSLLEGASRLGVEIRTGRRVVGLSRLPDDSPSWQLTVTGPGGPAAETLLARRVILATGGCSYPGTGSDGSMFALLRRLGHTIVEPVPALSPFHLDGAFHLPLAGVALPAKLALLLDGRVVARSQGPFLWTHRGASGPATLDLSGAWSRARADLPEASLEVAASFLPDEDVPAAERRWIEEASRHPRRSLRSFAPELPERMLEVFSGLAGLSPKSLLAQTPREQRRRFLESALRFPLPVRSTGGFGKAEVTSGGVPLEELDRRLQSKILPGVYLTGEMIHVDGRMGGFNFQWAWASAALAAEGAVRSLIPAGRRSFPGL